MTQPDLRATTVHPVASGGARPASLTPRRQRSEARVYDMACPGDRRRVAELRDDPATVVIDRLAEQVAELLEVRDPLGASRDPRSQREAAERHLAAAGDHYGRWLHVPWRHALVALLPPEDHALVRSSRDRGKRDADEAATLGRARVGVIGLSVGNIIARTLALNGVGSVGGLLRLADPDSLGLSNLNRVLASVCDIGLPKVCLAGRQIAELSPYSELELWPEGVSAETCDAFLDGLNLVVEVCDALPLKMLVRQRARARGIPVVMETSERGTLDVERFDLDADLPIFHGRLEDLGADPSPAAIFEAIVGDLLRPKTRAAVEAVAQRRLVSWPQLGWEVVQGGATTAWAAERILLGRPLPSGRYLFDLGAASERGPEPKPPTDA